MAEWTPARVEERLHKAMAVRTELSRSKAPSDIPRGSLAIRAVLHLVRRRLAGRDNPLRIPAIHAKPLRKHYNEDLDTGHVKGAEFLFCKGDRQGSATRHRRPE
jgi:hypothetical protein